MNFKPHIVRFSLNPRNVNRTLCFCLAFFLLSQLNPCLAQDNFPAGARSMAMSHASVSFSDAWSPFHNQAGIAGQRIITAAIYYESKYGIDELTLVAGSVVVPAGTGGFGVTLFQFGSGTYRVNKYALAYAHRLSKQWDTSLQLDYFTRLMPENDRSTGFATFEAGVLFRATGNLHFGAHLFNPSREGYSFPAGKTRMPLAIRGGGHYKFDNAALIAGEFFKESNYPVTYRSGIEFYPAENLTVRMGVSWKPLRYTAGFGYRYRKLSFDMGFGYHGNLGVTPAVSIQIDM